MTGVRDFHYFSEKLLNMGAISSAAELQGMLCGKLCGSGIVAESMPSSWISDVKRLMDLELLDISSAQAALIQELYALTFEQLDDEGFVFRPLLPADTVTLARRTEELANWCRGFLYGMGTSGLKGSDQLSADVAEALRDFANISGVEHDEAAEATETLESDWEELVEYVKVAVLNIREELLSGRSTMNKVKH